MVIWILNKNNYCLTTIKVAVAPVDRFHWFEEISFWLSSKTLSSAVLGPDSPWLSAVKSILLNPLFKGSLNPAKELSKYRL